MVCIIITYTQDVVRNIKCETEDLIDLIETANAILVISKLWIIANNTFLKFVLLVGHGLLNEICVDK